MNAQAYEAVDAISASPAIRLRFHMLAAKAGAATFPALPPLPDVGGETPAVCGGARASTYAKRAGDPLAHLIRLREKAADKIDSLINFLDLTDGFARTELEEAVDDQPCDTDELEPNLAGFGGMHSTWGDDLEVDGNDEPSLGSVEGGAIRHRRMCGQEGWSQGAMFDYEGDALGEDDEDGHDREDDRTDDEPSIGYDDDLNAQEMDKSDDEPSLGSSNDYNGNGTSYRVPTFAVDVEGPEDDLEPSLCGVTADCCGLIGDGDYEDDGDLHDDDIINEHTLGWPERDAQNIWENTAGDHGHVGGRVNELV